jgi:hypothetical protein
MLIIVYTYPSNLRTKRCLGFRVNAKDRLWFLKNFVDATQGRDGYGAHAQEAGGDAARVTKARVVHVDRRRSGRLQKNAPCANLFIDDSSNEGCCFSARHAGAHSYIFGCLRCSLPRIHFRDCGSLCLKWGGNRTLHRYFYGK